MDIKIGDDITTGGKVLDVQDNVLLVELPESTVWIYKGDVKSWRPNKKLVKVSQGFRQEFSQ